MLLIARLLKVYDAALDHPEFERKQYTVQCVFIAYSTDFDHEGFSLLSGAR
jgi:hypothetical protein